MINDSPKTRFDSLRKMFPNSGKSFNELSRLIGDARILRIDFPFEMVGENRLPMIRAELSQNGEPKTERVLLQADED